MAKRISEKQIKEIIDAFINHRSLEEISKKFNFTKLTITRHLKKNLGEDKFTTGTGGDSFNCDDILLGVNGTIGYEMQAGLDLRSDNRFVFEPLNAMTSFGDSIDPVLDGANGFKPREVAAVEIGEPPEPKLWLQMLG